MQAIPRSQAHTKLFSFYVPWLGQTRTKLYTEFRTERSKPIPCPVANPRIGHVREYPTPRGAESELLLTSGLPCSPSSKLSLKTIISIWKSLIPKFICEKRNETNLNVKKLQRVKKVVFDNLGLVDFAIGLVNSVLNLPDRQVKFLRYSNYRRTVNQSCSSKRFWG